MQTSNARWRPSGAITSWRSTRAWRPTCAARLRPNQRFMPAEKWQCNTVEPLARLFHMRIDFAGFVPMVGRDAYASAHGSMRGKLLGLVMCPSMLLVPAVSFAAVDDSCVHVTLTDANRSATALVYLDDNGRPRDFRSRGRYADLPGGLRRAEWSTPVGLARGQRSCVPRSRVGGLEARRCRLQLRRARVRRRRDHVQPEPRPDAYCCAAMSSSMRAWSMRHRRSLPWTSAVDSQ
jgi:uncharacterized protein DUF6544